MNLQLRDAIAKAVESLPSQGRSVRANEAALKAATGARRLLDHVTDTPSSKWVRKGGSPNGSILHLRAVHGGRTIELSIMRDEGLVTANSSGPVGGSGYHVSHPALRLLDPDPIQLVTFAAALVDHAASVSRQMRRPSWNPGRRFEAAVRRALPAGEHDNANTVFYRSSPRRDPIDVGVTVERDGRTTSGYEMGKEVLDLVPPMPAILTTMTHHSTRDICRFTFDTRMREHPALDALGRLRYERDVSRMRRTPR